MAKRTLPALVCRQSPLEYVIAQLRFSAVLSLSDHIPGIQDTLRKEFPRFRHDKIPEFKIGGSQPTINFDDRFEFQDAQTKTGIVLTPYFLAVHTTAYSVYDDFAGKLERALEVIDGHLGIGIAERLGLRYVDLIRVQKHGLEHFVRPELLGIAHLEYLKLSNPLVNFHLQSETQAGALTVRLNPTSAGGPPLPIDLAQNMLATRSELEPGEVAYIMDFDQAQRPNQQFSLRDTLQRFEGMHDVVNLAFRSVITDNALTEWQCKEVQ